jgi:hypothetical protein
MNENVSNVNNIAFSLFVRVCLSQSHTRFKRRCIAGYTPQA